MRKRVVTDETAVDALITRVDTLEGSGTRTRADLDAVTRSVSDLTRAIRSQGGPGGDGPRWVDWLAASDPDEASDALQGLDEWVSRHYRTLTGTAVPTCWPWHPPMVVLLAAVRARYAECQGKGDTAGMLALTTGGITAALDRVRPLTGECVGGTHREGSSTFEVDTSKVSAYAVWWATSREGRAPGLTPR